MLCSQQLHELFFNKMTSENKWSCREKLAIASYVLRSGELHWNNVNRLLKPLGEEGRPNDWFSSKRCAQKYSQMLEETEQPSRRKRGERSESSEGDTSKEEFLVKKLTQERIEELKRLMRIQKTRYRKLNQKIEQVESGELDDQLDDMIAEIEKPKTPPPEPDSPAVASETNDTLEDITVETDAVPASTVPETTEQHHEEEKEEPKEEESDKEVDNLDEKLQEEVEEVAEEESENKIYEEQSKEDEEDTADEPEVTNEEITEEQKEEVNVTIEEDIIKEEENTTINEELVDARSPLADKEQLLSDNSQEIDNTVTESIGISQSTTEKPSQDAEVENTPNENEEVEDKSVKVEEDDKEPDDEEIKIIDKSVQEQEDSLFVQSQSLPATPLPSNSSTAYESFPNSPALSYSSEMDHETTANYKAWRKSIMILWKQVASHRYASLFLQPVSDDIAPNYSSTIYRAMDLGTLKKNVENGMIRSTSEFQRDLMLMFQNALMYNNREHDVYKMANEMQHDVMDQVAQFLATQLMVEANIGGKTPANKTLRRSTMRRSVLNTNEKTSDDDGNFIVASTAVLLSVLVGEARSKRVAAIEGEAKLKRKKPSHE